MSTPYTLAEAFELLTRRQQRKNSKHNDTRAIDILGIVSNISNAASLPGRSSVRKCQIWLVDESLEKNATTPESNQSALAGSRFVLYDSSEIARVVKEKIRTGDILRFNGVTLKSFRGSLQFQFSSMDPEPGLSWFRLGNVDDPIAYSNSNSNATPENSIPKSMVTSKERVAELADWYTNQRTTRLPPSSPRALPTRKRRLDELQSSVGLLSHITVRVTSVRILPAAAVQQTNVTYRHGNRRNTTQRPPVAFATVVDDSGATMSFIDSKGRFLTQLKSAQSDNHTTRLVMTNVSTDYPSQLRGLATSTDEIVLVPTETTTVRLICDEKLMDENKTRIADGHGSNETQVTELLNDTDVVVHAGLSDVCVDGKSLKTTPSIFSSSSEFLGIILEKDGTFRRSIIRLDRNEEQVGSNGVPALPDVLKTLCGSLDVAELSSDEMLCMHSISLLKALLEEDSVLEWTLRKDEKKLTIVKAALHRLHG